MREELSHTTNIGCSENENILLTYSTREAKSVQEITLQNTAQGNAISSLTEENDGDDLHMKAVHHV